MASRRPSPFRYILPGPRPLSRSAGGRTTRPAGRASTVGLLTRLALLRTQAVGLLAHLWIPGIISCGKPNGLCSQPLRTPPGPADLPRVSSCLVWKRPIYLYLGPLGGFFSCGAPSNPQWGALPHWGPALTPRCYLAHTASLSRSIMLHLALYKKTRPFFQQPPMGRHLG